MESKNISLCNDGSYRWVYECNMYRNPVILFTLYKIFFFISLGIYLFMLFMEAMTRDVVLNTFEEMTVAALVIFLILIVLSTISYYILALIFGGKYCVLFEMDEKGISHTQMQEQVKKAEILGYITALVGAASDNPAVTGTGLMASSKASIYSDFSKVKKIKPIKRQHTIKLKALFSNNQIYAENEDFDFVLNYIKEHVKK